MSSKVETVTAQPAVQPAAPQKEKASSVEVEEKFTLKYLREKKKALNEIIKSKKQSRPKRARSPGKIEKDKQRMASLRQKKNEQKPKKE